MSPDELRAILRQAFINVCSSTRQKKMPPEERAHMLEDLARGLKTGLDAVDSEDLVTVAMTLCYFQVEESK